MHQLFSGSPDGQLTFFTGARMSSTPLSTSRSLSVIGDSAVLTFSRTCACISDAVAPGCRVPRTSAANPGIQAITCSGLVKPTRWHDMAGFCRASLMASVMMLLPCWPAYAAARLHASFSSAGAGCQDGGPCSVTSMDFLGSCVAPTHKRLLV